MPCSTTPERGINETYIQEVANNVSQETIRLQRWGGIGVERPSPLLLAGSLSRQAPHPKAAAFHANGEILTDRREVAVLQGESSWVAS